jgi:hypothetical protein
VPEQADRQLQTVAQELLQGQLLKLHHQPEKVQKVSHLPQSHNSIYILEKNITDTIPVECYRTASFEDQHVLQ